MSIMEIQVNEQWICQVISGTYHLTLQVFSPAGDLLEQYSEHAEDDRLLFTISDCQELLFPLIRETQKPQIVSSEFNQIWAGIPMINEDQIVRIIVLGPVFTSGPSKMMIVNYAHDYDVKGQARGQLSRALNNSPVCPHFYIITLQIILRKASSGWLKEPELFQVKLLPRLKNLRILICCSVKRTNLRSNSWDTSGKATWIN